MKHIGLKALRLACALIALCASREVRTAQAQIAVVSNAVEERVAAPGDSYTGTILLRNTSNQAQEVKLYQTDYAFSADGRTDYALAGSATRSNASWISLQPARVLIPPRGEVSVTYQVKVPVNRVLVGTYWSMVMVEAIQSGSPESKFQPTSPDRTRIGLHPVVRYGIQLATHMPAAGSRSVDLSAASVIAGEHGAKVLQFNVVNTGERAYRPKLTAELYDDNGRLTARFESQRGLIYPGSSVHQTYDLPSLSTGAYKLLIIADTDADKLFAAQYRLKL